MTSPTPPRDDRASTHIKALAQELNTPPTPDTAGVFTSGMLTGLAAAVQILDGATAETAMETVVHRLEASVGRAYLNGTLLEQQEQPDVQH